MMNHETETIWEAFGMTEDQYDKLVHDSIEVWNSRRDGEKQTELFARVAETIRDAALLPAPAAGMSEYEVMLFAVASELGKQFYRTRVKNVVDKAMAMVMFAEITGHGKDEKLMTLLKGALVATLEADHPHECKKCGDCCKEFDEDGNEKE